MGSLRKVRLEEAIKQFVSRFILRNLQDPRLSLLTITKVELSKDYRYAKIFFSVLKEKDLTKTTHLLNDAKGYIQSALAKHLALRQAPLIHFKHDASVERSIRINQLIEEAVKDLPGEDAPLESEARR